MRDGRDIGARRMAQTALDRMGGLAKATHTHPLASLAGPLTNAVDDAAAATAGVPVNGLYRNGSVVMIRVA